MHRKELVTKYATHPEVTLLELVRKSIAIEFAGSELGLDMFLQVCCQPCGRVFMLRCSVRQHQRRVRQ